MKTAVVFTCDDKYLPYTSVVARRVARYATEAFPITVVSDDVSDENKALAKTFCPAIEFVEASHLFRGCLLPVSGAFSRANYLRLFLDEILADFDYAVYLDSDISVLTDISPLLAMRPSKAPIIAAYDLTEPPTLENQARLGMSDEAAYFNSGVAIYDLRVVRQEHVFADALQYALRHPDRCKFVDQDAQNAVLNGRWQVLDWRWNALSYMSDSFPKQPFIRHFAGGEKPWTAGKVGIQRRFIDEWRADLAESPWSHLFQEQSLKYVIRNVLRPTISRGENWLKTLAYGNSPGKRGTKVRLVNNNSKILAFIEQAAAANAIAKPLTEFGR